MINHLEQKVLHIEKQNEEVLMMLKSIRECQKRDAKKHFTIENSPYKVSNWRFTMYCPLIVLLKKKYRMNCKLNWQKSSAFLKVETFQMKLWRYTLLFLMCDLKNTLYYTNECFFFSFFYRWLCQMSLEIRWSWLWQLRGAGRNCQLSRQRRGGRCSSDCDGS